MLYLISIHISKKDLYYNKIDFKERNQNISEKVIPINHETKKHTYKKLCKVVIMACSTLHQKKGIPSIEDIIIDEKSASKEQVQANMPVYKKMIYTIYDWMIEFIKEYPNKNIRKEFHNFYGRMTRSYRIYVKKSLLVLVYRRMIENEEIENHPVMWKLIQKCAARNLSGVTVITVLTSPYPDGQDFSCKHNCYYCPNEPDMPRSYLKKEPAVARGFRNEWDACAQMEDRINSLVINGHEIDKLEIIIEGGTYTEYPEAYLERFHRDLIYTANTYFDDLKREKKTIEEEIELNATAKARIIGICVETRPDALFDENDVSWLPRFRKWGVTRVQLGVQHTDDDILKKINRGHTVDDACAAIQYLKDNCFKVDIHLMPDLPNATPEKDIEMFNFVFRSPYLQPDQVKIYPCEVTPWTVIKKWHDSGKYKPYAQTNERALLDVVKYGMTICPPWIRLPRVIRDIPLTYIEGGNKYPNLRQMLNDEIEKEGNTSMDIRYRECGRHPEYKPEEAVLRVLTYEAHRSTEHFICFESEDEKCLFGFLRLRMPRDESEQQVTMREFDVFTNRTALVRELHVYGNVVPVGHTKHEDSQHKGFGRRMLAKAEELSLTEGCNKIAVISGIGVTEYYKKFGYTLQDTFMVKKLYYQDNCSDLAVSIMFLSICAFMIGYSFISMFNGIR